MYGRSQATIMLCKGLTHRHLTHVLCLGDTLKDAKEFVSLINTRWWLMWAIMRTGLSHFVMYVCVETQGDYTFLEFVVRSYFTSCIQNIYFLMFLLQCSVQKAILFGSFVIQNGWFVGVINSYHKKVCIAWRCRNLCLY